MERVLLWLKSRSFPIVGIALLVLVYMATQIDYRRDPRPVGTLDDLRALPERDDLNILFILIDTLRADHLGSYGYERPTSPGMDYLAEVGARFANHRAQSSWTKTSMASLWTGLNPSRTGVRRYQHGLPDQAEMPAELLRDAGFVTAGLWRNGWVAPKFGFQQGFDLYHNPGTRQAPKSLRREARAGRIDGTDVDVVFSAVEFMRSHADERWFLYAHFMDVHQYVTVEEMAVFGHRYMDAYDNSILWTDRQVMTLIGALEELGLRDRTIVAIASDHGEAFGEHGHEGHAKDLHGETTLTPLILSFPFILEQGVVVEAVSQNLDIWPTLLDLVGAPPMHEADGVSLVPLLLGESPDPSTELDIAQLDHGWGLVGAEPRNSVAIRKGRLRYMRHEGRPEGDELYDLSSDPAEQVNLIEDPPEDVSDLRERVSSELEVQSIWQEGPEEVELDELSLRQLRALGYEIEGPKPETK